MRFRNKRTGEIKSAYSIQVRDEKIYVKFSENGKEYGYNKDNIEVMDEEAAALNNNSFITYMLTKRCYRCQKDTTVYTYIVFDDGTDENVVFPWDKERLLKNQDICAHLQDSTIEYYGLKVVGQDEKLDRILMDQFPEKIKIMYSKTQGRAYPMNLCDNCGAVQGWNFIYRQVNGMVKKMEKINTI